MKLRIKNIKSLEEGRIANLGIPEENEEILLNSFKTKLNDKSLFIILKLMFSFEYDDDRVAPSVAIAHHKNEFKAKIRKLKGLELDPKTAVKTKEFVRNELRETLVKKIRTTINRFFEEGPVWTLIKFLQKDSNNWKRLSGKSWEEVEEIISQPIVIHKFGDGFYWADLHTNECEKEGEMMAHCGRGHHLYSLRSPKGMSKVTIDVSQYDGDEERYISQIFGKANTVPKKKYWPHIKEFIRITGIEPEGEALREHYIYLDGAKKFFKFLGLDPDLYL